MSKRKYAVIGHPIGHTMSPFIHERLFALAGMQGEYGTIDIAPEELPRRITELNALAGYNITIPNKQRIIPLLDKLDPKAALYGSVNTVRNSQVREGFTTDPDGFLKALSAAGIPFEGRVLLAGCGGVARTFAYEALLAGCRLTIAVRPQDRPQLQALMDDIRQKLDGKAAEGILLDEIGGQYDLLINATPVGMFPHTNEMVVSSRVLSGCENVFDAVYNPLETALLAAARANGSRVAGGMAMLVWQAAVAHEIWDGSVYAEDDIRGLIEATAAEQCRRFG